jgi:DNA-binding transcriptional LysR family regulator
MEAARGTELDDYGAIRALVKQSDAIAFAAYETIRADVETGELVVLEVPEDQAAALRPLSMLIATLEDRTLPPVASAVIEEFKTIIAEAAVP